MNIKLAVTLALMLATYAGAADYYVDYESGDDSNAGTSTGAPFQHCPGDPNATGNAATTTLAAGDGVHFRAGTTYTGEGIDLTVSGADGNPITIDGDAWGTGADCIIDGNNVYDADGAFNLYGASYVTVSDFKFQNHGGYAEDDPIWETTDPVTSPPSGVGINAVTADNVIIEDCEFAEIGQWQNTEPMSGTNSVTGAGVALSDGTDCMVRRCDFTRMSKGVVLGTDDTTSTDGVTIQDCEFHDYMHWLIDVAPRADNDVISNLTIDGCTFRDYTEFDEPNWTGFGEKPHQDGIFFRNAIYTGVTWTNVVVKNCVFRSDETSNGGTASIYLSAGPSATIYNCLFLGDSHAQGNINIAYGKQGATQEVRVYNNTLVGPQLLMRIASSVTCDVIDVRNNIFYRATTSNYVNAIIEADGATAVTFDNNLYWSDQTPIESSSLISTPGFRTFSSWLAAYPTYDVNSLLSDPDLVSISGLPSTWDVSLNEGSPAIGAGADLSAYFADDINGSTRSSWDIGAYEYQPPSATIGTIDAGTITIGQ